VMNVPAGCPVLQKQDDQRRSEARRPQIERLF
jgi:hypothetical protein